LAMSRWSGLIPRFANGYASWQSFYIRLITPGMP
jgi:hypothetical protein